MLRDLLTDFDWIIFAIVMLLSGIGLVGLYSAAGSYDQTSLYFFKQLIWIVISTFALLFFALFDYKILVKYSLVFYLITTLLLVYVLYQGKSGSSSEVTRWVSVGGFLFQPSEFAKISLILYLANYFKHPRRIGNLKFYDLIIPIFMALLPFILIFRQPDLGTASLLLMVCIVILFFVGVSYRYIVISVVMGLICFPVVWFKILKSYQKQRILTLLDPERDPLGTGYHVIQSKISIGSGQLTGAGFLQGKQSQLNFLPAKHTDFIFSVFSEEWGFLGSFTVFFLYFVLIMYALKNIGKMRDCSGAVLSVGIISLIAFHVFINLGMVMGLFPIVGMPLPFMSYGGSAMLTMMSLIGILISVRIRNNYL